MSTSSSVNDPDVTPTERERGKLGYIVIGIVVAICAGGWAVIMANAGQRPGIAQQTITYQVIDDSTVRVRYSVTKPKGKVVRCVVDALDIDFAQVAHTEITIPVGTTSIERTDTLHTSKRANAARVKDCKTI